MKNKIMKRISLVMVLALCLVLICTLFACNKKTKDEPKINPLDMDLRLIVPNDWELEIGDSRTVDYAFKEGIENCTLTWTTGSSDIATVDKWGRVTAQAKGQTTVTATSPDGYTDTVTLRVVDSASRYGVNLTKVDYTAGTPVTLGDNLQKIVTRWAKKDVAAADAIPETVKTLVSTGIYEGYEEATTKDGALWTIEDFGVKRVDNSAKIERDKVQQFMGDRWFYFTTSTAATGAVRAILADTDKNGIWTVTDDGVSFIEMKKLTGTEKAEMMVADTEKYVQRNGYVAEAYKQSDGSYKPVETDNDGLWTALYAVGELMRYATMKADPVKYSAEQIAAAKRSAYVSTEAVLLLANISMRTGTYDDTYVRYQPNGRFDDSTYGPNNDNLRKGKYLSWEALEEGGDYSRHLTNLSPAAAFEKAYNAFLNGEEFVYMLEEDFMTPYDDESWSNPLENSDGSVTYETRTRNLEGFIARTYSFDYEGNGVNGNIYWDINEDQKTATGVSTQGEDDNEYYMNGENLREKVVTCDWSLLPTRLWNDLKAAGEIPQDATLSDITYKGDTSSDEVIGHLFLWKVAYDVLGSEDEEIRQIIANTADRFAQHVSDNSYMMVDGTGQPDTWSKYNRDFFYNSSQLGGSPLTAAVCLSIFKVAYYVTGNEKWQNEYLMAALDPSYEYAKLMTQYTEQCYLYMLLVIDENTVPGLSDIIKQKVTFGSPAAEMLARMFLNYSDEEMAMMAFYLLFQMETDETLLSYYRDAIDDWWVSIKYSENPLWYYIYQLSRPNETVKDAYGNNILETAAWALSRHPVDTTTYLASNINREDIMCVSTKSLGGKELSFKITSDVEKFNGKDLAVMDILNLVNYADELEWAVAAPDERSLHKFNGNNYRLMDNYSPYCKEGSTTYTLPYWMGMYHGMLVDIA